MAWVSDGTADFTNNSKIVTGNGTSWYGSLQAGWGLVTPGGTVHEIESVESATQLTLKRPYQGATATAQSYSIFPTMSLAAALTLAVQQLISDFQGVKDTYGAGRLPNGTLEALALAFEQDSDTGIYRPGPNILALVTGQIEQLRLTNGVASGAAVQSSATDVTAGRLLKLATSGHGAFGLGGTLPASGNIDQLLADGVTGWVRASSGAQGSRADFTSVLTMAQYDGIGTQVAFGIGNNSPLVSVRGDGGGGAPGPWFDLKTDYDLQADATDNTDGKIWKSHGTNGAFGLGAVHAPNCDDADLLTVSGLYRTVNDTVNTPISSWGHTILHQQFDQNNATQLFSSNSSDKLFFRRKRSGAWQSWEEIITGAGGQTINGDFTVDTDTLHVDSALNRLGLGTTTPADKLHVLGSAIFEGSFPNIRILETDTVDLNTRLLNNAGQFLLQTMADNGAGTTRMIVDHTSGNIGIGAASPSHKLEVNGFIKDKVIQGSGEGLDLTRGDGAAYGVRVNCTNGQSFTYCADLGHHFKNLAENESYGFIGAAGLSVGTSVPYSSLHVIDRESNGWAARVVNNDAAYTGQILALVADRAASPDFSFIRMHSNGGAGDIELELTGDGLGKSDRGWQGNGADYAEFLEWLDGNPNHETRTGVSVVLEGDKIRPAQDGETPIGVISANPSVIGDGDIDRWKGKYLKDDFGTYILEDYEAISWTETVTETETVQEQAAEAQERTREVIEVVDGQAIKKTVTETIQVPLFDELPVVDEQGNPVMEEYVKLVIPAEYDENGDETKPEEVVKGQRQVIHREPRMIEVQKQTTKDEEHSYAADEVPEGVTVPEEAERVTLKRRKLNPEYDPSQPYVPRAERPEWDLVGLMGKLRIRKGQPVAPSWIKMRDVSDEVEEWLLVR